MLGEFRIYKLMDYLHGRKISVPIACKKLGFSDRDLSTWESKMLNCSMAQCNICGKWFNISELNDKFDCKECGKK